MIHDLSRVLVAQQTHRRMVDAMSLRRWDRQTPFLIERVDFPAASASTANGTSVHAEADKCQGSSHD
jgi:hypothetical protein